MKLSLRLIPILAIAIKIVTFSVARNQVRSEKQDLRADLERRAEILAESLQETVEPVLQKGSMSQLRRLVDRFGNREHLAGVAICDVEGKATAVSSKLDSCAETLFLGVGVDRIGDTKGTPGPFPKLGAALFTIFVNDASFSSRNSVCEERTDRNRPVGTVNGGEENPRP
jgi:hypothetical protein